MGDVIFIIIAILLLVVYISLMRKILKIIKRKTREKSDLAHENRIEELEEENQKLKKKNKRL